MKSNSFIIQELVDRETFEKYGEKAWRFLDPRMIEMVDIIKERFPNGTMTINNWFWNGDREWSGLRTPNSPWYSMYSMHSFGGAFDAVFSDYTAEEVRQDVIDNPEIYKHVKGIEMGISWFHGDTRNQDHISKFKP